MLKGGAKLADLAGGAQKTLSDPFAADVTLKELATAGAAPFSEATGQLAYADANRLNKQFAKDEAIQMATDAAAAAGASAADIAAVTASMTNYGYDQSEIDNIISQFFSNGGRVGLMNGGEPDFNSMREVVKNVGNDEIMEGIMSSEQIFNMGGSVKATTSSAIFTNAAPISRRSRCRNYQYGWKCTSKWCRNGL